MKIDIMTLFPEMINAVMRESIIGRAQDKGVVEVKATDIRDYALDKHHKADDAPYGGGTGQGPPDRGDADRSCWLSRCICAIRR